MVQKREREEDLILLHKINQIYIVISNTQIFYSPKHSRYKQFTVLAIFQQFSKLTSPSQVCFLTSVIILVNSSTCPESLDKADPAAVFSPLDYTSLQ